MLEPDKPFLSVERKDAVTSALERNQRNWYDGKVAQGVPVSVKLLAIHPDQQRCGYGSELMRQGMELFADKKLATVLTVGPGAAKSTFEKIEFRVVGSCVVKVDGDDEELVLDGMIKDFDD